MPSHDCELNIGCRVGRDDLRNPTFFRQREGLGERGGQAKLLLIGRDSKQPPPSLNKGPNLPHVYVYIQQAICIIQRWHVTQDRSCICFDYCIEGMCPCDSVSACWFGHVVANIEWPIGNSQ